MSKLKDVEKPLEAALTYRPEMAFPLLSKGMIECLYAYGAEEPVSSGTTLWSRGDREVDMFVLLTGVIDIYGRSGNEDRKVVATLHQGQFSGELDLLSSRQTLLEGCATTDCIVLRISRPKLQRLMRIEADIANLIMQATIWRRLGIIEQGSGAIVLIGEASSGETIQLQRFLTRNSFPYRLVEPGDSAHGGDSDGTATTQQETFPVVAFSDGRVVRRPSIEELADELGLTEQIDSARIYDVAIVGAGPSGLAAAVYSASEGLSTLVIEGIAPGGQAGTSSKIENYLGFPTGVSGFELAGRAQVQAQKFGARLVISRSVRAIRPLGNIHQLELSDGSRTCARSIVIATGAQYRKLNVANYERFEYQGIHYAATAMEASLCRDQEIAVIGGGNSAGQAAVFLSGIAKHVHLIVRGYSLASTMSQYLISRIENHPHITLHVSTEIENLAGDLVLSSATWVNRDSKVRQTLPIGNIFVMVGAEPNTGWLYGTLALDNKGFIRTGDDSSFENTRHASSVSGVYAIGDVRSGSLKRVAAAVGEGSAVVSDIHRYLAARPELLADESSTLAALQGVIALNQGPSLPLL